VLASLVLNAAPAGILATGTLDVPLAPESKPGMLLVVAGLDPSRPVACSVVALSAGAKPRGEVATENSVEGVVTSNSCLCARRDAMDMDAEFALGAGRERVAGTRSPADLRVAFREPLHAAYAAVVAGTRATLDGRVVQTLPAPGRADAALQVSATRAEGIQPKSSPSASVRAMSRSNCRRA
jgi:hypothetical protein